MALPLLGLLAVQGARAIATRIAGSAATRRKVANILKRNFEKAQKKSLKRGKIPTDKTLTQGLTKDQKGLLSNLTPATPKPSPTFNTNFTKPNPVFKGRNPIPTQAERIAQEKAVASSIASQEARRTATAQGASASRASQAVNENISRQALNNQRIKAQQAAYGQKPITQTVDTGLGNYAAGGLLTGLSVAPMFMPGGEQPTQAGTMSTGRLLSQAPQQEQAPAMRFGEVLRPSSQSTAKEVLNAALLRAGLSLMKPTRPGQTPLTQALESASTVASSQTSYTSGEQALAAGKVALGENAKISVSQRSDGTFGYQGTTTDTSLTDNSFFGEQPQGNNVTKEQYDKAVATIKAQAPDATEQDIKDTLEANNIRYTGE